MLLLSLRFLFFFFFFDDNDVNSFSCYRGTDESHKLPLYCLFPSALYNITLSTIVNKLQWKLPLSHSRCILLSLFPARSVTVTIPQHLYDKNWIIQYTICSHMHLCNSNSGCLFRWFTVGREDCD